MKRDIINLLPNGAEIISLDKFGGQKDVIKVHFNDSRENETLYAYKYNNKVCLSVLKYVNDKPEIIDTYNKDAFDISYLCIAPVVLKNDKNIVIGFKISDTFGKPVNDKKKIKKGENDAAKIVSSELVILTYSNGKFENVISDEKLVFNKIDVLDMDIEKDGIFEIALWNFVTEKAYKVSIYSYSNGSISETHEYDKNYYDRVFRYYRHLVKNNPDSAVYLYYFANAQHATGYTKEALKSIESVLKTKHPYPSKKDLLSFKEMLEGKDL